MREIKFRAWEPLLKRWFDRVLASSYTNGPCSLVWIPEKEKWANHDGPIVQSTGLKDKNGKDIFEGYIVRCQSGDALPIVYGANQDGLTFAEFSCGPFRMLKSAFEKCEIIGNIYENPELVKP